MSMKWVSAKEKLPTEQGNYLISDGEVMHWLVMGLDDVMSYFKVQPVIMDYWLLIEKPDKAKEML